MHKKQRCTNTWLLPIAILLSIQQQIKSTVLPSILWNPYNPVFSCDLPTLRVKIDDDVTFICPFYDAGFLTPPGENTKELYENIFYIGDNETAFENCDSTNLGSRVVLNCDKYPTATTGNSYKMTFRSVAPTPTSFVYTPGKYYYFIGTGFRTEANINNRIGGSCKDIQTTGIYQGYPQYKLRMRVYICKNDEDCGTCKTNECLYKDCQCWPWKISSTMVSADFTSISQTFQRTCRNFYDDQNRTETKTVLNTTLSSCTDWKYSDKPVVTSDCIFVNKNTTNACTEIRTKTCKKDDQSFQTFCQYVPTLSDCQCSPWKISSTMVSADFTSISQTFQRTCRNFYDDQNRTETKTVLNTTLSACTDWTHSDKLVLTNNCIFVNKNTTSTDTCTEIRTKKCRKDDQSFQTFCQYVPVLSDCQCSPWKISSTLVSADFTSISQTLQRTCRNLYDDQNRTETQTVLNTTLSACTDWTLPKENADSNCLYLNDGTSSKNECTRLHIKQCKNDQNKVQYICSYLPTKCPNCTQWVKMSETHTSDYKTTFLRYQKYCPNGTLTKTEVCPLSCTPWTILNSTNQCTYSNDHTNNLSPGQCSKLHQRYCSSTECNLNISLCQNIGITCPACQPWMQVSSQPSANFKELLVNQSRACIISSQNVTEYQQKSCPMTCTDDWVVYNQEKHGKCVVLSSTVLNKPECEVLNAKSCDSAECGIKSSYCQLERCQSTPRPAEQVGTKDEKSNNIYVYVGIPLLLVMFLIGLAGGFFGYKIYHRKNCMNFRMKPNQVDISDSKGRVNLAYQTSVIGRPDSVYYVDDKISTDVFKEEPSN